MCYTSPVVLVVALALCAGCTDTSREVPANYLAVNHQQITLVVDDDYEYLLTCAGQNTPCFQSECYSIDSVLDLIDSLLIRVGKVNANDFRNDVLGVEAALYSHGSTSVSSLYDLLQRLCASDTLGPCPPLARAKVYDSVEGPIPWDHLLFYHVRKDDAMLNLKLLRNEVLFWKILTHRLPR